jgi:sulfite dehydrogenase (cytochrome) subunit A
MGGANWVPAKLEPDLGRFAWRRWTYAFTPARPGETIVMARARNNAGATQVEKLLFNGGGYYNNVVQRLSLQAI